MKIAVVWNSHVVALKEAISLNPVIRKGFDITFFAAPARDAHNIKIKDGKILPMTERAQNFSIATKFSWICSAPSAW